MLSSLAPRLVVAAAALTLVACESVPDVQFADDGGIDATIGGDAAGDAAPPIDAGPGGDASDAACLASGAPANASCCFGTFPCAGEGCAHCADCAQQSCKASEYCCAHVNPQGTYLGVLCSQAPASCP